MIQICQWWLFAAIFAAVIPAQAAVTNMVADAKGQPVAGATVTYYQDPSASTFLTAMDVVRKDSSTTDSKGRFAAPSDVGLSIAVIQKEGMAIGWRMYGATLGESVEPLTLTAPTTLAGTVVDGSGKPVADAEVWVSAALQTPESGFLTQRNVTGLIFGKAARDCFSARTSADGRFRISNFPANSQADLSVHKAGLAARVRANFNNGLPYASGQQDIKLTLDPAGNIAGKVTADGTGQPIAGAKLRWATSDSALAFLIETESVTSGADGSFRLNDLPTGKSSLIVTFPGNPVPDWVAENTDATVTARETKSGLEIKAFKGGVAVITVLSQNGRKPVPDAYVTAYTQNGESQVNARTGSDGVARLRLLANDWTISASGDGWNPGQDSISISNDHTNRVEIDVSAGSKITGIVRDSTGTPVAGATISINPNYNGTREVQTDAAGHYEIAWQMMTLGFGGNQSYSLMARDIERNLAVKHDIDESTTNLDLTMQPGVTLTAKIEDPDGKPIPNATGTSFVVNENGGWGGVGQSGRADSQGRMEIPAMPPADTYALTVNAKGYGTGQQQVRSPANQTNHIEFPTIVLSPANLKLGGKVVGEDGKPVIGVTVQFWGQNQPNGNTQTDAQGHFFFDAVCAGPVQVNASSPTGNGTAQTVGGDTNVLLNLQPQQRVAAQRGSAGLKISGTVRDVSGAPAVGARVRVMSPFVGAGNETRTGPDGHYSITWQTQQNFGARMVPFLMVRDTQHDQAVAVDIDETTSNLDLNLQPGLTLTVKAQDVSGKPLATASATVMMRAGNYGISANQGSTATSDENGVIEIEALPQERFYTVNVTAKGYGTANPTAAEGDTKTTRFELPAAVLRLADRKLAGQVLGADNKPAPGANVSINGDGQPNSSTTTDAKGHFSFDGVCEGTLRVFANSQGGGVFMNGNTEAQAGDTNVVIHFGINGPGARGGRGAMLVTTTGKVFDLSGKPVAGARLVVAGGIGPVNAPEVLSDAEGKFSINWQFQNAAARGAAGGRRGAPASQMLLVARDRTRNLAAAVEITEKSTSVDVHLEAGLTLTGSVEDPDAKPLRNATIQLALLTARRQSWLGQQNQVTVDDDGSFSISALPQGQVYSLNVAASGYGNANRQVSAVETQTASFHVPSFRLKLANLKLEGQVVDENGKAVSGASVQINGVNQANDQTTTDSKGHFAFKQVCDGPVQVMAYVMPPGGGAIYPTQSQAQGGDTDVLVKLGANRPNNNNNNVAVRQSPPRTTPPRPQSWAWINLRTWPNDHKVALIVLAGLQGAALLGAAGAIFLIVRRK